MEKQTLFISHRDLLESGCLDFKAAIDNCENTLKSFSENAVDFPEKICQIFDAETQSRINCLPATVYKNNVCGVKWISVFPDNPKKNHLPNISAVIVLSDILTGRPLAVMDGALCSNLRTASVTAVAAKYLCNPTPETIGFIGAGEQAKMNFLALKSLFPSLRICKVASRSVESEQRFIAYLSKVYPDVSFIACNSCYEQAARESNIIVTAISGQAQLLQAEWIGKGTLYCHIGGLEDSFTVPKKADKIICDSWNKTKHRSQTISKMYKLGLLSDNDIYCDLHEIASQNKIGRTSKDEFIYFNAVGLSYIDISIAYACYQKVLSNSKGSLLDFSVINDDLKYLIK